MSHNVKMCSVKVEFDRENISALTTYCMLIPILSFFPTIRRQTKEEETKEKEVLVRGQNQPAAF